jgi:hypothetical protein
MRKPMKLLLTNDDGIEAPGIQALREATARLGERLVVTPADALSGCSHRVTTSQPIRVAVDRAGAWRVHGTPADCARLALHVLAPDVSWVLAGINEGGNLGADVYHSGTVAAVREAVLHGRPGIAVSHYHKRGRVIDWQRAATWVPRLLLAQLGYLTKVFARGEGVRPERAHGPTAVPIESRANRPGTKAWRATAGDDLVRVRGCGVMARGSSRGAPKELGISPGRHRR